MWKVISNTFYLILIVIVLFKRWIFLTQLDSTLPVTLSTTTTTHLSTPKLIRIMSLNFFLRPWGVFTNKYTGDYKTERLHALLKYHLSNYDIVCFQEVFGVFSLRCHTLVKMAQKLGFHYYVVPTNPPFFSRHLADNGLLILSRFPIVEVETVLYKHTTYIDQLTAKGFQYCKIYLYSSHYIHLINTHIQSDYHIYDPQATVVKLEQLSQIRQFLEDKQLFKSPHPLIIAGDLNCNAIYWDRTLTPHEHIPSMLYLKMLQILGLNENHDLLRVFSNQKRPATTFSLYDQYGDEIDTLRQWPDQKILSSSSHWICLPRSVDYILFYNKKNSWMFPMCAYIDPPHIPIISDHTAVVVEFVIY
jgi:endonuclease/exonuclease/phosphatase family metal-dependent hydrolase